MAYDNKVRIIAGAFKGRRLDVMDLQGLRPTTERVRETVFNWLGSQVVGATVLDLFAGSGALGLEALSRGATEVTLVEKDRDNADLLSKTVKSLPDLGGASASVHCTDALAFLKNLPSGPRYDLIFLDPPFSSNLLEPAVELIVSKDLLKDGGQVYVEMGAAKSKVLLGLSQIRDNTIGQCHFGLYERSFFC